MIMQHAFEVNFQFVESWLSHFVLMIIKLSLHKLYVF
jgi:hypothetical protein